jgi:hypothetical protein
MDDTTDVEALLTHGGWALVDPRPTALAHPDTFEMPSAEELGSLRAGSLVKVMVRCVTIADEVSDGLAPYDEAGRPQLVPVVERMWAVIVEAGADDLECVLDNHPFATHCRLVPGAGITVPRSHVIGVHDDPVERLEEYLLALAEEFGAEAGRVTEPYDAGEPPRVHPDQQRACAAAGVLPHPPAMFGSLLLAQDVGPEDLPLFGGRFDPDPDRGDVGWVLWARHDGMAVANEAAGFRVVSVQEAHRLAPKAWPYLALPPRWGFTVDADGGESYPIEIED